MEIIAKKRTNKGKFSLYMDKTLMQKIAKIAERKERSVNFVVEKFKDCKTLEDFQNEFKWIESRSFNFM